MLASMVAIHRGTSSAARPDAVEGTYYEGECQEPSLSGDYAVTATFGE